MITQYICKALLISTLLFTVNFSSGQKLSVSLEPGFGSYSMDGLKELNSNIIKSLPLEAKITDNFPNQPFLSGSIVYQNDNPVYYGISVGYYTTGSRISYKDYSGELKIDNIISAYTPGMLIGANLTNKILTLKGEVNLAFSMSKLEIVEKILNETDELNLESNSFQLEPRIRLTYFWNNFEFGLRSGYLIDFGSKYNLEDNPDAFLENDENKAIKSNWSGLRIGISATYGISLKKE